MAASLANNGVLWFPPPKPVEPNLRACQNTLQQTNIVQEWIREHGSDETSDMHLVVQESGVETRIPVSRDVLRITSGLMRGLPEAGDMPVLGEHAASTVVKFTRLCYPSFKAPPKFSLAEISSVVRLAHWFDAPPVIELLHDQFKATFDALPTFCAGFIPADQYKFNINTAPEPDLYAALFSMKDAGKHIELSPYLALHFPAWFIKLENKERARFNKYARPTFLDFMAQCEALKNADLAHPAPGNVLRKSSELLLQLSRFLVESYRTYDSDDSDETDDDEPRPKRPRPSEDSSA